MHPCKFKSTVKQASKRSAWDNLKVRSAVSSERFAELWFRGNVIGHMAGGSEFFFGF
jgi:hypothetical protein